MAKNKKKVNRDQQPSVQRRKLQRQREALQKERLEFQTQRADEAERRADQAWAAAAATLLDYVKVFFRIEGLVRFRFQDLGFKGFASRFRIYGCLRGGE